MRILSGIQPSGSGELHIGNYLGAIRQWKELQNDHEVFFAIVDLHAITVPIVPQQLRENVLKLTALYLALGIDPSKATIFVQSKVPAHSQMTWLLNTITYMGELERMTQYKDKGGDRSDSTSVGLFDYPVLMAADILLYQADQVPVGSDQKQHLELARNLAERFNKKFEPIFKIPEYAPPIEGERIMGLDDPAKKMSKSLGAKNYLSILDDRPKVREKIMSSLTDSDNKIYFDKEKKPGISNLLTIFSALSQRPIEELVHDYDTNTGYGQFKHDLAEAISDWLDPIQENYAHHIDNPDKLHNILTAGSNKANEIANKTLEEAKGAMGFLI